MTSAYDNDIKDEVSAKTPCCRSGIKDFGEMNATGRADNIVYCKCPKGVAEANKIPTWMNKR